MCVSARARVRKVNEGIGKDSFPLENVPRNRKYCKELNTNLQHFFFFSWHIFYYHDVVRLVTKVTKAQPMTKIETKWYQFCWFFNRFHPKQGSKITKTQGVTWCGKIRNRNANNEQEENRLHYIPKTMFKIIQIKCFSISSLSCARLVASM